MDRLRTLGELLQLAGNPLQAYVAPSALKAPTLPPPADLVAFWPAPAMGVTVGVTGDSAADECWTNVATKMSLAGL